MAVYVDKIRLWPTKLRTFKDGACHMFADTLDELHEFAARIGLKREWFQDHHLVPHYDLNLTRRAAAVRLGAKEVSMREALRAKKGAK